MKKLTIEDMYIYAKSKEGLCLSTEYVNNRTKIKWQCKKGHVFYSTPDSAQQGKWCPECGHKRTTELKTGNLIQMQIMAKNKFNGACLSTEYISSDDKLKWQCEFKHVWLAAPNTIQQNHGCPKCYRERVIDKWNKKSSSSLEKYQKIASEKGGECLSKEYVNNHTTLLF